ncbi:aminotransferase [Microbacterium sp. ZW T5_45]|uniref:aminotransferase n=1 Tax=Microbacterium sp. ZW T5_45 TaxID=3378080 RepID=UPI0038544FCD
MSAEQGGGLVRPDVDEADAATIARECYGLEAVARELGSNQDRNFVLIELDGARSVLRVDNPVFGDEARDAQHTALDAYRRAGVSVPAVLPGLDGELTQRWRGFAVRRSQFAEGEPMVDAGYFAPAVLADFGTLAAASVNALSHLEHPGLDRPQMWDMRVAHDETLALENAITDAELRARVRSAADDAQAVIAAVESALPVQPIHGDLTDDNVTGVRGSDSRLHPRTVLDLGDLGLGWRVAELAVCVSSMLHHEPDRPLRVLETIAAFHADAPLSDAEARAVWPLVVLRASLLVASGWRQLEIDGDNDYARERIATEQTIFDAATLLPLGEMTEAVLDRLGVDATAAPFASARDAAPLGPLLPGLDGPVTVLDLGVESPALDEGLWLSSDAEAGLVRTALDDGAAAVVLPYGAFRLSRAEIDSATAAPTWPVETEIHFRAGGRMPVASPHAGRVQPTSDGVRVIVDDAWTIEIRGVAADAAADGAGAAQVGRVVEPGEGIGSVPASDGIRTIAVGIRRTDAPAATGSAAQLVEPERVAAWARLTADPAPMLGLESRGQRDHAAEEQRRRERLFASAQERYYERPPEIERGWRHHLVDTTGRAYIDMVNNVAGLGHSHPKVADAANRQLRTLGTNSRFLFRDLAEYSERLLALMPEGSGFDTVLLVNSGSEAVDLAIRLAQAATGRRTVVSLREAYHGWTMASDAVTTSAYDNPYALETRPDWVHVADVPNAYRGTHRGEGAADRYLADLDDDIAGLTADGREIAAFLCESILGNAGGVLLADGYLPGAYERIRAAGGLCIADEVQVGFGRVGSSFWGFEVSGVIPDIVTIAKPMGNGYPIGGVITTKRIADALATQGQFFSSAGGSTVSCRVGIAVLDAMVEDDLQRNALVVGERLANGLRELTTRHPLVGPVHGAGLYLGVELVRDQDTLEPAAAEAAAICERLRELGVIVLTTSERSNVLKIKPPLCLTPESADHVVRMLDWVLSEGW